MHHLGYWVDDLSAAIDRWNDDLGVGPFRVHEHITFEEFVLTADGGHDRDVVFDHSAAFAAWGPIVVELGQVHAIDPRLAREYAVRPGAIGHVSWVVDDLDAESDRLRRLGCRPINTARTGPISVAWHHGGPLFPHPIELHQRNPVIDGMHAGLVPH
jgi:catechol 2,3-dioxygenase-like lactoylglutathione lyase family enzyme